MMNTVDNDSGGPMEGAGVLSRDHDVEKGALDDGCPITTTNAPGLDADGLPQDEMPIAADALGARVDGSQG